MGYAQTGHGGHHAVKGRASGTVLFAVGRTEQVVEPAEEIHAQALQRSVTGAVYLEPGDLVHDQRDPAVLCMPYDLRVEGKDVLDGRALAYPGDPEDGEPISMGMAAAGIVQAPAGY